LRRYKNSVSNEIMKKKMKLRITVLRLRIPVPWLSAYDQDVSKAAAASTMDVTPLPSPSLVGSKSLEETLAHRRSVREFSQQPLTLDELGQLLWAAQGVTNQKGKRTAPSAGRLYPLEIYLVTAEGVFHYRPDRHELAVISQDDARSGLYKAAERQEQVRQAPAVFVVTAVYERTASKYGQERTPCYVRLEAGHAAQNLLLQAVALGLGAVPVGAFQDEEIQSALQLPVDRQPLYLIPVGHAP
jgi:SagB-type dehydrogenase family enzyme